MKLTKLLAMLMFKVDVIELYNKNMTYLYSFPISDIPENCEDKIIKFNISYKGNERILEVIEK